MKQAQGFLAKKEQVRLVVLLKGRQKNNPERAAEFLNELNKEYFTGHGKCVKPATATNLGLTLMPIGGNNPKATTE